MDSGTRQRVEGRPGSIPLRSELVEFLSARCLSRYSRCSKAVREDVREANLWQLLAAKQAPRPTPQTARGALEIDAISRVRSHLRRRLLADALAEEDRIGAHRLHVNRLEDFTFFVRIAKGGRLIWEGDLKTHLTTDAWIRLSLIDAWATIRRSGSCAELTAWLARTATLEGHDTAVLGPLSITLVAIRDVDQAMISLGHFSYDDHSDGTGEPDQEFEFLDAHRDHHLFSTPNSQLRVHLYLGTHHDAARGTLTHLDLAVRHYDWAGGEIEIAPIASLDSYQLPYLLTYLAGVQPFERAAASRTIASWGEDGWLEFE
jgi:hypothetical protein